ncbi:MAG: TrkA family potassium uptake protein [Spirochaetes bacterium]|nr:TrkA family potassium uptake protein [Spirochaetota bacterium]
MKKFLVIGLGNFGMSVAKSLMEGNCEVLGIDMEKENVQRAKDFLSHAIVGDASNRSVLSSLPIRDFDGGIVSIGQEMGPSILISLYLKEMGIENIIVRAISDDHVKVLELLGISEIVFPERDIARRLGKKLSMKNALDYLPLTEEYAILEVNPPHSFINKTLRDLAISAKYGCQVLGIRYPAVPGVKTKRTGNGYITKMAPSGNDVIQENSVMIVLGKQEDIERLQRLR